MATWKRYGLWHAAAGERPAAGEPADGRPRDARLRVRGRPPRRTRRPRRDARAQRAADRGSRRAGVPALRGRRAPVRARCTPTSTATAEPFAPDASNQPVFLVSRADENARAIPSRPSRWSRGARRDPRPLLAGRPRRPDVAVVVRRRRRRPAGGRGQRLALRGRLPHARGERRLLRRRARAGVRRPRRDREPPAGRARPARSRAAAGASRPRSSTRPARPRRLALARRARRPRLRALPPGGDGHGARRLRRGVPARPSLAVRRSRPCSQRRRLVATLRWDLDGDDWCRLMGTEHMTGAPVRRRPRAGPAPGRGRRAPARRRAPRPPRDGPDRPQAPVLRRRRPRTRRTTWRR